MMNHQSSAWLRQTLKLGAVAVLASSCTALPNSNKLPIAVISVMLHGEVIDVKAPIDFTGQPVTITLDGANSSDPDGSVTYYRWMRTDVSGSARRAAAGGSAAPPDTAGAGGARPAAGAGAGAGGSLLAPPPAFVADPAPGMMSEVVLTEGGKYRFTLWVTDNEGVVGKPTSVTLQVGAPPMAPAP
jgi:hypothetical protein